MSLSDLAFLLLRIASALLCFHAARLAWRQSRLYGARPERRLRAWLGAALVTLIGILAIATGFDEVVLRAGIPIRPIDWARLLFDLFIPGFYLVMLRALDSRDALERQLAAAAEHDPLTGLPNRAGFQVRALAALADGPSAAFALLDIDHFKSVNDGWGHAAGDALLRGVAQAARGALRAQDVLGRVGGEEFALILPGASPEAALPLVERLRQAITGAVPHPGAPARRVTLSAGIAPIEGADAAALDVAMARADGGLYAAKSAGRDRALIAVPAAR